MRSLCCHQVTWLATIFAAGLGCDAYPRRGPSGCPYIVNLAVLRPDRPTLHIGDTLTVQVASWAPIARECLPPDMTAAGLRWWTDNGVIAIDSISGHVTALRPGGGLITLAQAGVPDATLGQTTVGVYEPPGADSVITIVRNYTGDSAWVVLLDAGRTLQRSQTVVPRDSACWVTPLSDSVQYSVTIRPSPPPPGSDSGMARWVPLAFTHTWSITINPITSPNATVTVILGGVSPDPGTGC